MNFEFGLHVELLELRRLLAGDVTVSIGDTNELLIRGDAANNSVAVESPDGNFVWLRGADGTTINGEDGPLLIGGNGEIDRKVRIQLMGGDDQFAFDQVDLLGEVNLSAGAGHDTVLINGGFAFEKLDIDLGSGDDHFGAANSVLQRRMFIKARSGDDHLQFTSLVATDDLTVLMHGGNDQLELDSSTVLGNFTVGDLGAGNEEVTMDDFNVQGRLQFSLYQETMSSISPILIFCSRRRLTSRWDAGMTD